MIVGGQNSHKHRTELRGSGQRVPSDEVVVQPDGILEPALPHGTLDVLNGPLEWELGTVDADDREVGLVLIVHSTQEWEGALAVHAREGPEFEQDDAVAKGSEPQRLAVWGVEPRIDATQTLCDGRPPSGRDVRVGTRA